MPLIREALYFCGIIENDTKTNTNIILDNLLFNQKLICKLEDIIRVNSL